MFRSMILGFVSLCAASVFAVTAPVILDNADTGFRSDTALGVPIFMYHGLDPSGGSAAYDPVIFEQQIKWLRDNGFETITFDHFLAWQQNGTPALPAKPIILTFDDNYITIYTVGFPILKKYGFFGYNFTHTYYVGVMTSYDHADWIEIAEMERDGTMFTESHTVMHLYLTQQTATSMKNELENSKKAIESNINGKTCRFLAYPYGDNNATVQAATKAAGYTAAVTTVSAPGYNTRATDPYLLSRHTVNPQASVSMGTFASYANAGLGTGGAWASTSVAGAQGGTAATKAAGTGTACANWQWTPTLSGDMKVSVFIPVGAGTATNATYTVRHKDGIASVTVDQASPANAGQWVALGTFPMLKDRTVYVALNNMTNGTVVADAVKIEPLATAVEDWSQF